VRSRTLAWPDDLAHPGLTSGLGVAMADAGMLRFPLGQRERRRT